MVVTISTWNIHGSGRPDVGAVARHLETVAPDVATLQEVQRGQATAIARTLGWPTAHWSFKHFPVPTAPEGLAVLSPHPLVTARTVVLSRWAPPWSFRRRIAQLTTLRLADGALRLANVHLASDRPDDRLAQTRRLLAALPPESLVAGDLNARPGSDVLGLLTTAGLRDAWATVHPDGSERDGATHWRRGDPAEQPTQRLDYILVPGGDPLVTAAAPTPADSDLAAYRELSDHLPFTTQLDRPG